MKILMVLAFLMPAILNVQAQKTKGKPWNKQLQQIPGRLQCEWYDLGGEGVAYHDADSINNGSGKLNPANGTALNEFRMKEAVDISYTKPANIDINPYNMVEPDLHQLYVGWTQPGEWINYTVKVNRSGIYKLALMYTASGNGQISLSVDGEKLSGIMEVPSTRNEKETIDWRQWHHWNKIEFTENIKLKKGDHVLTLNTVGNGNMNFDYFDFILSGKE